MGDAAVALLLAEDVRLDPRELGEAFATALGVPAAEARMKVRRARGLILERAAPEQAERLRRSLEERGIASEAHPLERLPNLPPPMRVAYLERAGDLLAYRSADGVQEGAIAWSSIGTVVAAAIGREAYDQAIGAVRFSGVPNLRDIPDAAARELVRENLILAVGNSQQAPPPPAGALGNSRADTRPLIDRIEEECGERVKVYVDILPDDASLWLRASMGESSYRLQEEGVRMGSALGMRRLLRDLQERAARARIAPMLRALLEPAPLADAIMADVEEMSSYTIWTAYRAWLQPSAALDAAPEAAPSGGEPTPDRPAPAGTGPLESPAASSADPPVQQEHP
jgi:hypothetical protein